MFAVYLKGYSDFIPRDVGWATSLGRQAKDFRVSTGVSISRNVNIKMYQKVIEGGGTINK